MIVYVEDILNELVQLSVGSFDRTTVYSLNESSYKGFTEKQAKLVLRLCYKYRRQLSSKYNFDIAPYLENPTYRTPVRMKPLEENIVSVKPHDAWGKDIQLKYPYNEALINSIRETGRKNKLTFLSSWIPDGKYWSVNLTERNLVHIRNLTKDYNFKFDEEILDYFNQIDNIINNIDQYSPMLCIENGKPYIKNSPEYLPKLASVNMLDALFEARYLGVSIWDENFENYLKNTDPFIERLLNHKTSEKLCLNLGAASFNLIKNVIQYLGPILVVVNDKLLEKSNSVHQHHMISNFNLCYAFLKEAGINSDEISVMFRLSNKSNLDKDFNETIKNNYLNNPISEKTKVVFISDKVTKPVLKSNIKFNSLFVLADFSMYPHSSILNYIRNIPNLIYFGKKDLENSPFNEG
jgi:hypothetical protein